MEGSRDSHGGSMSKSRRLCVYVCVHKCMAAVHMYIHACTCTHTPPIGNSDKETVRCGGGVMKRWVWRKMQIGLS